VALEGSIFVKRTGAASGFDDVAAADAAMTEVGVPLGDRAMFLSPRTANGMASNLASRTLDNSKSLSAYEKAYVGDVAGFETYKNDQSVRLAAATGGAILVNGAGQYREPVATSTGTSAKSRTSRQPLQRPDRRRRHLRQHQGGRRLHHRGRQLRPHDHQGGHRQLQTFRVISKPASNTIRIAPAIISNGGSTIAGKEYQNVTATPADNAALTWLNTVTAICRPSSCAARCCWFPAASRSTPRTAGV
jgi:hypothetical protein